MAQGTRNRWLRAVATGFGVVLCTGLVGCTNTDKRDTKIIGKQPGPGLTGTPTLPGGTGAGAVGRTGQPASTFNGPGGNLQPAGGTIPGAGLGQGRTGNNTLTTAGVPPANFSAAPGGPGGLSAPAVPGTYGTSVQPAGGFGSASQYSATPGAGLGGPPAPALNDTPLPPPPPPYGGPTGGVDSAGSSMISPPASYAPVAPVGGPPAPPTGKVPPLSGGLYGP